VQQEQEQEPHGSAEAQQAPNRSWRSAGWPAAEPDGSFDHHASEAFLGDQPADRPGVRLGAVAPADPDSDTVAAHSGNGHAHTDSIFGPPPGSTGREFGSPVVDLFGPAPKEPVAKARPDSRPARIASDGEYFIGPRTRFGRGRLSKVNGKAVLVFLLIVAVLAGGGYLVTNRPPSSSSTGSATPVVARPSLTLLSLSLPEGQPVPYQAAMQIDAIARHGGSLVHDREQLTSSMSWRAGSVGPDGVATIDIGTTGGIAVQDGRSTPQRPLSMQMQVAPDGRILNGADLGVTTGENGGPGVPGMDQVLPVLPAYSVAPGASWDTTFRQWFKPFGTRPVNYSTHSTFEGVRTVEGRQVDVIVTTIHTQMHLMFCLRTLMNTLGVGGVPADTNPYFGFIGVVNSTLTSLVDAHSHFLVSSTASGRINLILTARGRGTQGFPRPWMRFTGTFTTQLRRGGAPGR
jgi:hypothetical protein